MPQPTPQQNAAIAARGNVLVMAGAGTGKTSTLVARLLDLILEGPARTSLDRVLVVTFTEAAAMEMRHRLRLALEARLADTPNDAWLSDQIAILDIARVSTLHAFCLRLLREHFHQLGLDPQFAVQDPMQTFVLRGDVLTQVLRRHYREEPGADPRIRDFLERFATYDDAEVRSLILRVHDYARTLAETEAWLREQRRTFEAPQPDAWRRAAVKGIRLWAADWQEFIQPILSETPQNFAASEAAAALRQLHEDADTWNASLEATLDSALSAIVFAGDRSRFPRGRAGAWREPLRRLFDEAAELRSLLCPDNPGGFDPLIEDWNIARQDVLSLLTLVEEFFEAFQQARRSAGVVDFADLEQLTLQLLWDPQAQAPTELARHLQHETDHVFVDEYQDINGAQDRIITCLSRSGPAANRFFVGDIKQSIYRFRRGDPRIFQEYAMTWRQPGSGGIVLPLAENFRSHPRILDFVNEVFVELMRADVGGVPYDAEARLLFGAAQERHAFAGNPEGRVELLLQLDDEGDRDGDEPGLFDGQGERPEDLDAEEAQAGLVAARLRELHDTPFPGANGTRRYAWRDMVVLHPTPRPVAERWARQFNKAGIPFETRRGGFFDALEVSDLINLIRLLDNPRQDLPLLAVLRSPIVGMTADELVMVRVARRDATFWDALNSFLAAGSAAELDLQEGGADDHVDSEEKQIRGIRESALEKAGWFREHFERWRRIAREGSLEWCLESVLADTAYEAKLRAAPLASARIANIRKLLGMARDFDQFQRHGLFRFLQFLEAQSDTDYDAESAIATPADSVRLISIHQSKGLEFPVVVVAGLGRPFQLRELQSDWILDEELGICPPVAPRDRPGSYPSITRWLAEHRQRRETMGEQIRLFYVAATRAAERLLLVGAGRTSQAEEWNNSRARLTARDLVRARSPLSWLGPLIPRLTGHEDWLARPSGTGRLMDWRLAVSATPTRLGTQFIDMELPLFTGDMETLRQRLSWRYPHLAATTTPAKMAVTRLTRQWQADPETPTAHWATRYHTAGEAGSSDALERGMVHHLVLELLDVARTESLEDLSAEIARLEHTGSIDATQASLLDREGLWVFWNSPLGHALRNQRQFLKREVPFTARLRPAEAAVLRGVIDGDLSSADDFQLIQGIVDLALIRPDEIWIVDFKTDDIEADEVDARARDYALQLRLYAHAMALIYGRPVTQSWLYFLTPRQLVPLHEMQTASRGSEITTASQ